MAFWKSEDDKKEEMEELKRQVEGKGTKLPEPPSPSASESPELSEEEFSEMPEDIEEPSIAGDREEAPRQDTERKELPDVTRRPPQRKEGSSDDFAPLFVKIDKYNQVLQNLEEIRSSLDSLKELFELMNEVDEVKRRGMNELKKGMSDLANTLVSMDEKFIRPEGTDEVITEPETQASKTVSDLQKDLRDLRDSLERIE